MVRILLFLLCLISFPNGHAQEGKLSVESYFSYNDDVPVLNGYLGNKLDLAIQGVKNTNTAAIIEPFRHSDETWMWQSEFWGKWITSAILSYEYSKDPQLKDKIDQAFNDLVATQSKDGYIGNYRSDKHLEQWDIWGRKYVLLGLQAYYDMDPRNNKKALNAAMKVADHLIMEIEKSDKSIHELGNYRGLASGSVMEPMVHLYNRTGKKEYLDFAMSVLAANEKEGSSQLITKALSGIPVSERIPLKPGEPWNLSGQKAYEMMSCYEGILELYKVTGNPDYLQAAEMTVQNIIEDEINIAGSGSAYECWFKGKSKQMEDIMHFNEICVTTTWIKLCNKLFLLTGNPKYLEQIETSMYNALIAGLTPDGSYTKYPPLQGYRSFSGGQCGLEINCCSANGTRAFALYPKLMYTKNEEGLCINMYEPSSTSFQTSKGINVEIEQQTSFPKGDFVVITIQTEKPGVFSISLRIPSWGGVCDLRVNDFNYEVYGGLEYQTITREWKSGDKIILKFDLQGHLHQIGNYFAITRGPLVLARDSRFGDGSVYEPAFLPANSNGIAELEPCEKHPGEMHLSYSIQMSTGISSDIFHRKPRTIHLCDFGSAGNTWNENSTFKVWFKQPLDVTEITRQKE